VANAAESAEHGEIESWSLVELAVSRLRRQILSGSIDPGERLVEEQLTRRLGISRAPLREALRLLTQQGLVEHLPRRGVRVAVLSDRDVAELYTVRDVLEQHVVTTVFPIVDPALLAPLQAALDLMRAASAADDRLETANAHRAFHLAMVALAGNRQLTQVYESILVKLQLYMARNLSREAELAEPDDGVRRHERLYEAIHSGDPGTILHELAAHGARSYLS